MVRIRVGDNWKHNPAYVRGLRALAEGRSKGFSPRDIVDVVSGDNFGHGCNPRIRARRRGLGRTLLTVCYAAVKQEHAHGAESFHSPGGVATVHR